MRTPIITSSPLQYQSAPPPPTSAAQCTPYPPVGARLGLLRLQEVLERLLEGGLGRLAEYDLRQFPHGPRDVCHREGPHPDQVPVGRVRRPILTRFLSGGGGGAEGKRTG